jgi:hypothetical protein
LITAIKWPSAKFFFSAEGNYIKLKTKKIEGFEPVSKINKVENCWLTKTNGWEGGWM